uniref:Conserved plasma membrane protein n=1 Tax=Ascaris lumbricoides TaxID=6252 RepID=A0A0M3HX70_ASCLU
MEFNAALQEQYVDNLGIEQVEHMPLRMKKLWWFFITDWLNGFLLWLCYFTVLAILVAFFASYTPVAVLMSLCAISSFFAAVFLSISRYYNDYKMLLPFIFAQRAVKNVLLNRFQAMQVVLFALAKIFQLFILFTEKYLYSRLDFGLGITFAIINCPITIAVCIFGIVIGLRAYRLFKARGKAKSAPNTTRLDELPIAPVEGTPQLDEIPKAFSPSYDRKISDW